MNLLGLIDVSDYVATPGSPRLLLGAERECYELSKGTDSERAEVCFDDGVLLYGEQQGGASTHIVLEATSYSREVAASEFELPYPPVEPTPSGM